MDRRSGLAALLAFLGVTITYAPEFLSARRESFLYVGTAVYLAGVVVVVHRWREKR